MPVRRAMIDKHGKTPGCEGCLPLFRGKPFQQVRHDSCRARIQKKQGEEDVPAEERLKKQSAEDEAEVRRRAQKRQASNEAPDEFEPWAGHGRAHLPKEKRWGGRCSRHCGPFARRRRMLLGQVGQG